MTKRHESQPCCKEEILLYDIGSELFFQVPFSGSAICHGVKETNRGQGKAIFLAVKGVCCQALSLSLSLSLTHAHTKYNQS